MYLFQQSSLLSKVKSSTTKNSVYSNTKIQKNSYGIYKYEIYHVNYLYKCNIIITNQIIKYNLLLHAAKFLP